MSVNGDDQMIAPLLDSALRKMDAWHLAVLTCHPVQILWFSILPQFISGNALNNNKMQDKTIEDNTMQGKPDGFKTAQKIGNDQENSRQFLHH